MKMRGEIKEKKKGREIRDKLLENAFKDYIIVQISDIGTI